MKLGLFYEENSKISSLQEITRSTSNNQLDYILSDEMLNEWVQNDDQLTMEPHDVMPLHACVEKWIAIIVFLSMGLALKSNVLETKVVYIVSACVRNFHYQTCLLPWDQVSSNYLYQGYLKYHWITQLFTWIRIFDLQCLIKYHHSMQMI